MFCFTRHPRGPGSTFVFFSFMVVNLRQIVKACTRRERRRVLTLPKFILFSCVGAPDCRGVGGPAQDREDGVSLLCQLPMFCFI